MSSKNDELTLSIQVTFFNVFITAIISSRSLATNITLPLKGVADVESTL
ncbi:hypothetical protein Krac_8171 [Ktedonobacter racemifer DSM 44963]|uniref:Uncharacterized protein n=1 Tax=Ktedonobacter racemifer DSM 44963 TaxID=485913 RepID=D6TM55_KTERA|nr:hypothetical protein Krac_8171 [Ktedonobacter racemifer DSM 44963]